MPKFFLLFVIFSYSQVFTATDTPTNRRRLASEALSDDASQHSDSLSSVNSEQDDDASQHSDSSSSVNSEQDEEALKDYLAGLNYDDHNVLSLTENFIRFAGNMTAEDIVDRKINPIKEMYFGPGVEEDYSIYDENTDTTEFSSPFQYKTVDTIAGPYIIAAKLALPRDIYREYKGINEKDRIVRLKGISNYDQSIENIALLSYGRLPLYKNYEDYEYHPRYRGESFTVNRHSLLTDFFNDKMEEKVEKDFEKLHEDEEVFYENSFPEKNVTYEPILERYLEKIIKREEYFPIKLTKKTLDLMRFVSGYKEDFLKNENYIKSVKNILTLPSFKSGLAKNQLLSTFLNQDTFNLPLTEEVLHRDLMKDAMDLARRKHHALFGKQIPASRCHNQLNSEDRSDICKKLLNGKNMIPSLEKVGKDFVLTFHDEDLTKKLLTTR